MHDSLGLDAIRTVKEYYGQTLKTSADLKTNACCATPPPFWVQSLLANVSAEVQDKFYGCGFPIPEAVKGRRIVDLGCGSGRDAYLLSQLVGEAGEVIGVDMTAQQLAVAIESIDHHMKAFGYSKPNVSFREGYIEDLDNVQVEDESVDIFVSNCVVNLSPRKDLVLEQVSKKLKTGGEFYLSDVVVDRRLPDEVASDPELYAECLGGAMYRHDFEDLAKRVGLKDPRVVSISPIEVHSSELAAKLGAARFYSLTYRLFKLPELEPRCEDYGQVATYKGGIPLHETLFELDDHHAFEVGRPERVCGNTADMLQATRFGEYFDITGSKSTHYGPFDCSSTMAMPRGAGQALSDSCC